AAAGVTVLGVVTADTGQRLDTAQRQQTAISSVLTASDAVTIRNTTPGSVADGTTVVRSRGQGKLVMFATGFPAIDPAHAYQVWLIGPDGPHSAGLLPPSTTQRPEPMLAAIPPGADRVGITVEPAGGSTHPTSPAVAMLALS
ncbi:anti-sigma factor, partial [Amycolatopsis samaneae]|uniref:anti-sigma factor n=1 Tax=Amycolatopsis samaneae TaxID=664691 RepID=UPI00360D8253